MDDESDFSEGNEGEEAKEAELDPENPEHAFPILERNFNKTVAEIEQDANAAHYADEFYKLFEFLYQTYQSHKLLEDKYNESLKHLEDRDNRIELSVKLAAMDKTTMNDLEIQIEHAWKLADAAHLREQLAQEIIDNLRRQIETLNTEIEFKNKMSMDTTEEMGEANKKKDTLEREKEKLLGEVHLLNQKLNNALEYQTELEKKNSTADLRINEIAGQLEDQTHEIDRFKRIREKLDHDISELNVKIEEKEVQISDLHTTTLTHAKQVATLETIIKEEKASREKIAKEHDAVTLKLTKLQDEYNNALAKYDDLHQRFNKRILDLKTAEDEVVHLKNELSKVSKAKEIAEKKYYAADQERSDIVQDRNKLRQRIAMFEREIDDFKKQLDYEKRIVETLSKEKENFNKAQLRSEALHKDQQKLIKIQTQGKKKLEAELDSLLMESNKFNKIIKTLEREKDHLAEAQLSLTKRIEEIMDEVKLKKAQIYDLKKSETEQENRYKMQQNLFDAVRSERNAMEKTLQEMVAESGELKKKLKMCYHQIEQLKEDVSSKERQLIKEENIFRKIMKEKENLKIEMNLANDTIKTLKVEINEKDDEERRLHKTIMDNHRVIRQQAKELEQLMNERDILGSQLVRRNDEIGLLHEKILILQSTLHRGESQYDQRLQDIKLLKIEIRRLRQEKKLLTKSVNNAVDLKQEVFHLERDLTRARLKCRALEEELQNPLNVHRWRKLEGSDPELLDLLQKIQLLQKRLLRQSSEAVEKERQLKEIDQLYTNLKTVLSKQPGPAIQEELNKTQRALKFRGEKLKCLVSELNMAELQAKEYKSDLQRVTEELKVMKQKYLAEKKAQRYQRTAYENSKALNQDRNSSAVGIDTVKFTGGGFRMSVDSIK